MKSFKNLVEEQLLNEMPYALVGTNNKRFDLEIEKFVAMSDIESFLDRIRNLLKGEELHDKYGNIAKLESEEYRKNFIDNLKKDASMPLALWKLFIHWMSSISSETN